MKDSRQRYSRKAQAAPCCAGALAALLWACGALTPPQVRDGGGAGGGTGGSAGGGSGGGSCQACTAPPNSSSICSDGGCDFTCRAGFHRCLDHCAADDSVNECGQQCLPCSSNTGVAICVQGACDFNCGANQAKCQGQCVGESDARCGPTCASCDAKSRCVSGVCQLQCPPRELVVQGRCSRGSELETGSLHACARHDGGVVCWGGAGVLGTLGSGPDDGGRAPRFVSNLGEVASLALGDFFSCALLPQGAVRCWGSNQLGQVGNGGTLDVFTPALTLPGGATAVVAGARHACGLLEDGGVQCWGDNILGQIGIGTSSAGVRSPRSALLDGGAAFLFAGGHGNWAIAADAGISSWGDDSLAPFQLTPRRLTMTDGGVAFISASQSHACAIRAEARLLECWGRGTEGQLGYSVATTAPQPMLPVPALGPVVDVCTGFNFTCALIADGGVRCFGTGETGQLGGGNFLSSSAPVAVDSLPAARQLSCHYQFACATTAAGIYCWGDNSKGQLGQVGAMSSASPILVPMP